MRGGRPLIDPFAPGDGPPPRRLGAFLRWAVSGGWPVVGLSLVTGALNGLSEVVGAFLVGWVIDDALGHGGSSYLIDRWPVLLAIAGFFLILRPATQGLNGAMTSLVLGPNLTPLVLSRLHRHTLGQAMAFFDDDFAGRLSQKQMQTARAVTDVALEFANVMSFALALLIGAIALVGNVNWRLGLAMTLWMVAYFFIVRWFLPRIRARAKARAGTRAAVSGQLVDTISNIATVKLFARSAEEDGAAIDAMERFRGAALSFGRMATAFRVAMTAFAGTLPVVMIGGVLWLWGQGLASTGDIAMAGLIATRLAQMTGWVSFTAMGVFSNIGEIEDGVRTLAPPHDITDADGAMMPRPVSGDIRFEEVTFTYDREGGAGLDRFSLHVAPGEKLALVGPSGAGKTTAVSLMLRLYELGEGRIRLDGHDIRDLPQDGLRAAVSMVRQDTAMFNRSARDNILYGRPDASEADLIEASRRAHAHEFITQLEDGQGRTGYDAHLGERGVKLSGGQRQRIALARAILKDAPVLVLDEATSALDSEVEALIQDALVEVMAGRTVIAIAHRLSTIAQMDRIAVMDAGRIVELGTHEELLASGGLYADLWSRQSGGFLPAAAE
ncbi:ABC transporter ATP-binding protein [Oceanomicrobium pacificus]|uniref:ATP-binding cassette domain-containing protein n=1 Tax=Oceanomicrobium pacificus TaxID=2692916 RepID=A0A6B0TKE3_9RHOB|nr:ABC transporter ATP-binding protein [Oceanomicrobium pacificus]MXU64937.1 ATP-binding cassette domain-containing protein [Oceanomicrobium pacificus]